MDQVPPQTLTKKGHTKPWMFFQTMQCPSSTEECDLAHVPAEHNSDAQLSVHHTKLCRYFISGHCNRGSRCKFMHQADGKSEDRQNGSTDSVHRPLPRDSQKHRITNIEQHDCGVPVAVCAPSYMSLPSPAFHFPPAYLMVRTSPPPPMLPLGLRRSLPLGGELISPTCSSDSISTLPDFYSPLSESSTSVADEGVVILMEDFHMSKGAVPLHTASRSIDDAHVVPSYLLPNINTFSTGQRLPTPTSYPNPQATVRPVRPARSKSRPRPQKAAAYKSKPCKFYKLEGVCPSGEQCTFIHDRKLTGKTFETASTIPTCGKNSQVVEPPPKPLSSDSSQKLPYKLPSKPLSPEEQGKKKGFFPISWRVIGGGVMIGGPSQVTSGRESAQHHNASKSGLVPQSQLSEVGHNMALSAPSFPTPLSVSTVPTMAANPFPSAPGSGPDPHVPPSPRLMTRTRAVSSPCAPASSRVDLLFSAESPGSL